MWSNVLALASVVTANTCSLERPVALAISSISLSVNAILSFKELIV